MEAEVISIFLVGNQLVVTRKTERQMRAEHRRCELLQIVKSKGAVADAEQQHRRSLAITERTLWDGVSKPKPPKSELAKRRAFLKRSRIHKGKKVSLEARLKQSISRRKRDLSYNKGRKYFGPLLAAYSDRLKKGWQTRYKQAAAEGKEVFIVGRANKGRVWIYNEWTGETKRIAPDVTIPLGWRRGRSKDLKAPPPKGHQQAASSYVSPGAAATDLSDWLRSVSPSA